MRKGCGSCKEVDSPMTSKESKLEVKKGRKKLEEGKKRKEGR